MWWTIYPINGRIDGHIIKWMEGYSDTRRIELAIKGWTYPIMWILKYILQNSQYIRLLLFQAWNTGFYSMNKTIIFTGYYFHILKMSFVLFSLCEKKTMETVTSRYVLHAVSRFWKKQENVTNRNFSVLEFNMEFISFTRETGFL